MAGERRFIPASEFCASVRDGTHDSPKAVTKGRKLVTSRHLTTGRLDLSDAYLISEEDFEAINKRSKVDRWDVLISMIGTVGEACLINEEPDFAIKNIGLFKTKSEADGKWLYYFLRSKDAQQSIREQSRGTTQQYIPLGALRDFPILIAEDPAEQKAIASVLGALDDKIELNRRMNATLEAMARALFQSWFVDFDPVRAKLDGRQPGGMDKATAALFPDSFQDSELGLIPKGWRATTLGEECERGGGSIQTGPFGTELHASDYVDEGVPSIMPSDLRDNRIEITEIARIRESDAERLNAYRAKPGDVVYSRRGDVERRSLIRHAEAGWLCGTGCLRVRFGSNGLNPFFGASYLGSEDSRAWVVRHAVGATMPNLNTSILGALPIICPQPALQACFAEIVGQWDERGTIALHQSRTLANLRDTLLLKLLSGELSVNDLNAAAP
jgi:type I restriction enzyme S subunit